jgi:hypothetical protein
VHFLQFNSVMIPSMTKIIPSYRSLVKCPKNTIRVLIQYKHRNFF